MSRSRSGNRRWLSLAVATRALSVFILFAAVTALLLAAGTASAADTDAPEWGNASKGNATTIEIEIYDTGTLDTDSIDKNDFVLTRGDIQNISVTALDVGDENRTGARVSLVLERRLNVNNVTVGLRSGASISDNAGNTLPDETVTVTGMDTIPPVYRSFSLTRVNSSTAEIAVGMNEPLKNLTLSIAGRSIDTLSLDNFTADNRTAGTYTSRYRFPEEGEYSLLLLSATDQNNNSIDLGQQRFFRYDSSAPNVSLEGPTNATVGEQLNFSAVNSTDDQKIESFSWRIDGGTILTGESIRVAFASPGSHQVSVTVADPFGNSASVTRQVTVTGSGGTGDVNVTQYNSTYSTVSVDTNGYSQRIQQANASLVDGRNASVERFRATFPANKSVSLTLRAADRTPPSLSTATGDVGLLRFDVDHGNRSAAGVTFTFAVNLTALNRSGAEPSAVTLYRDEGGWVPLDTTVVSRQDSRVVYQASSPGLSTFVVGAAPVNATADTGADASSTSTEPETTVTPTETDASDASAAETGQSEIVVTNVTVQPESPGVGEQAILRVDLENRGTATGDYLVQLFLNDSVLTTRAVTVPAGETRTTEFARELPDSGPLEVGTRRVANVSGGDGSGGFSLGNISLPSLSLPNPLALWPSGLVGAILTGLVGSLIIVYSILKALAIYLGY